MIRIQSWFIASFFAFITFPALYAAQFYTLQMYSYAFSALPTVGLPQWNCPSGTAASHPDWGHPVGIFTKQQVRDNSAWQRFLRCAAE